MCLLAGQSGYGADGTITIGVVFDGSNPDDRSPLQDYLARAMGRAVIVASPDSYGETVAAIGNGSYDFACLGALVYVRARAKYGVIPLVQRATDLHYRSVFITATGSHIYSLNDLRGKRFAFGDIDSTSGRLMPYRDLKQAGINPETDLTYRYSGSHLATAALVANGAVDAGAIDKTVLDFLIRGGQVDARKVRVFYTSEPYVDYVWVARPGVSQADRKRFSQALLALKEGHDDRVLKILRAHKFVEANDAEYDSTRLIEQHLRTPLLPQHLSSEKISTSPFPPAFQR